MDVSKLAVLLREAQERHRSFEVSAPEHHWSGWYAAYISARQQGGTPEEASRDAGVHVERELAEQSLSA